MSRFEESHGIIPKREPAARAGDEDPLEDEESELGDSFLLNLCEPSQVPDRLPVPGEHLGGKDGRRFEILAELGRGGMGQVLRAYDKVLQRIVALKFLLESLDPRCQEEARLVARLDHENIVRLFDLSEWRGVPYLIMEYLEGQTLSSLLRQGPLPLPRALHFLGDISAGLMHAHAHGVIHRDLKPGNVVVLADDRVKLLDFGIAQLLSSNTRTPARLGTPSFMAPEQWRGGVQDERTDIWAAGLLLYQMVTGELPYPVEEARALGQCVMSPEPVPSARTRRPDLPEQVERLLARALAKEPSRRFQSARELHESLRTLERSLAPAVPAPREYPRAQRRQVTLVSCRLSGLSTSLDPEDLGELQAAFHQDCSRLMARHGGLVIMRVGDLVLACFGHPHVREDDLVRAVRAAHALAQELRAQVGVHTDVVVMDAPELSTQPSVPTLQGDAPQLASWLSRMAPLGSVVLSENTYRGARAVFETEPLGSHLFTGSLRVSQVRVHRLVRERPEASRFERVLASGLTPLVGRTEELKKLLAQWELARQGKGSLALLTGEAGIGKSRLIQEVRERAAREGGLSATGQCWPQLGGSAFHPLIELMERLLQLEPEPQARLRQLEAVLASLGMKETEDLLLLAQLFSLPAPEGAPPLFPNPERQRERTLEVLATLLLRLPSRPPGREGPCPLLLVLEDLHWADRSTLQLLALLHQRVDLSGLFLVLSARPEFQPSWPYRPWYLPLMLERLPARDSSDMVQRLASGRSLPPEMVTYLVEKTEGIPLFVEELTRALFERTPASGEVSAEVPLPVTLHELLLARLDPLPPEQKELAWMGSVFGRSFTRAQLSALSPRDDTLLRRDLEELVSAGVLRPNGAGREPRYEFRHALIQDAAYQSLLRTQRRQYHRRIAELLATPPAGVEGPPPELVAHHYAQAGAMEPALSWWMKAGALALRRSAHVDAVTHFTRALRLLQKLPEGPERDRQELALQLALGAPLMSTRGYAAPEVRETYARALELSRRMGDDAQLFPSVLGLWQFYMVGGEARVSAELGRQLLAQAERTQEPVMLMLAYRALGTSLMLLGELVACREHMERGLLLYDREKHGTLALRFGQDPGVTNGLYLSWSLWFLGHVDQSVVAARKALALARSLEHPLSIAFALNYLAAVHNYRGEHATAQALAEEAGAIASEHRLALWLAMSKIQRGWAALATAPGEGVALLEEGISGWRETGAGSGLTFFLYVLGWGQRRAGQLDAAMKTLERAEAIMRTQGERFYEAGLWCLRGELTLASGTGRESLAEDCFRHGLEVARQQRTKSWELRLSTRLGALLQRQGRSAEALQLLQPLYAAFTEGRETADLRAARVLLDELTLEGGVHGSEGDVR